jgi:hypothetical protein
MDRDHWLAADRPDQVVPPGAALVEDAIPRLQALLDECAGAFAESRFGNRTGISLRPGRRGLVADEAASFLRGLDARLLEVDGIGSVTVPGCRPKPGGGRYSLFSANWYSGDLYVSLNLEYLIQLGASCELVAFHGWPGSDIEVEVGEFDCVAHGGERVVLAMEAKARIDGPDSLTGLWESFVRYASSDSPPVPVDNHSRKYVELLRLAEAGPVIIWFVAAQARWAARASRIDAHIELVPVDRIDRADVLASTSPTARIAQPPALMPDESFALFVGRLTEFDGQQRCYEFPWRSEDELDRFLRRVHEGGPGSGLAHARPWKWRAVNSGGEPLSPSGRTTGLELRFSYYAR